jgi:hypothetical protein
MRFTYINTKITIPWLFVSAFKVFKPRIFQKNSLVKLSFIFNAFEAAIKAQLSLYYIGILGVL